MIPISNLIYATPFWCLIALQTHQQFLLAASAFQPRISHHLYHHPYALSRAFIAQEEARSIITHYHYGISSSSSIRTQLQLVPEMHPLLLSISNMPSTSSSLTPKLQLLLRLPPASSSLSSILLTAENTVASEVAEWRQYVPLVVSVGVILDILLGSPLANVVLGPMKRASEKGAGGGGGRDRDSINSNNYEGDDENSGGRSLLFSTFSGNNNVNSGRGSGRSDKGRGRERVDSEAIAQAALNKALNTLELKRFLEENKTDEQRYEEVRKKIDKQMEELEDD